MGRYSPTVTADYGRGIDFGGAVDAFLSVRQEKRRQQRQDELDAERRAGVDLGMSHEGYSRMAPDVAAQVRRDGVPDYGRTGSTGPFPEAAPVQVAGDYLKTGLSDAETAQRGAAVIRAQQHQAADQTAERRRAAVRAAMMGDLTSLYEEDPETARAIVAGRPKPPAYHPIDPNSQPVLDAKFGNAVKIEKLRQQGADRRSRLEQLRQATPGGGGMSEAEGLAFLNEKVPAGEAARRSSAFRALRESGVGMSPGMTALAVKQALGNGRTVAQGGTAKPKEDGWSKYATPAPAPAAAPQPVTEPDADEIGGPADDDTDDPGTAATEITDPGQLDNVVRSMQHFNPAAQLTALRRFGPQTQAAIRKRLSGR